MVMNEPSFGLADLVMDPDLTIQKARALGRAVAIDSGVLVVEHGAIREVLQDRRVKNSLTDTLHLFGVTSGLFHDWMGMSPLDMEGDEHRRWRVLMSRAFTPQSVEKLRPAIREESERLVAAFIDDGTCDFVETFARQLPSFGLAELIGVPIEDREIFSAWADTIGYGLNFSQCAAHIDEVDAALAALLEYSGKLVDARRREPRDDLVSRIALATDTGLREEQIRGSVAGLVFAGHETTKNQMGLMISVLSRVPEEWDRVAREPSRARAVVEEVLRYRSAATGVGRIAIDDLVVGGCPVHKGTRILASLWAANRDPEVYAEPDRVDPDAHGDQPQLAFGHGAHHCIGASLARAELQEALMVLSSRITCPHLEEGSEWAPQMGITGPKVLPIRFERRLRAD
jgi:hypothetical protein